MIINNKNLFYKICRRVRLRFQRWKIKEGAEAKRSIVCNNCLGGVLSNNYNIQFCSPFVNLWIPIPHYIEICENIYNLKDFSLSDITPRDNKYPIGLLNGKWTIHFMHYKTFDEAKNKWMDRINRIDYTKLYFILVETSCTIDDLLSFDKLPFNKKIALVQNPHKKIKSTFHVKGYAGGKNGEILWPSHIWGTCLYDQFDWLNFLDLNNLK